MLQQRVKRKYDESWEHNTSRKDRPYVFISYSHASEDAELVYPFVEKLLEEGVHLSIDLEYGERTESWVSLMNAELKNENCRGVLAFFSQNYVKSFPSLIELLYMYSEDVRNGHMWEIAEWKRNKKEEKLDLMPISLRSDVYIKKMLKEEIGNKENDRRFTPDPNTEVPCYQKGLEGLQKHDKKEVSKTFIDEVPDRSRQVAYRMKELIVNQEEVFDNCNKIDQFGTILTKLRHLGVCGEPSCVQVQEEKAPCELPLERFHEVKAIKIGEKMYNVSSSGNAYVRILLSAAERGLEIPAYEEGTKQTYYDAEGRKIPAVKDFTLVLRASKYRKLFTLYDNAFAGAADAGDYPEREPQIVQTPKEDVSSVQGTYMENGKGESSYQLAEKSGSLCQPVKEFRKTFGNACEANRIAFKKSQRTGKTPALAFEHITLLLPNGARVSEPNWKPLFGRLLDAFYERSQSAFFDACVEEAAKKGNSEPYVLDRKGFEEKIAMGNRKHYQSLRDGEYWFKNWYSAEALVDELMKWMERYNRYLERTEGVHYTLEDYFVEYLPKSEGRGYFKLEILNFKL
ncbi:MAG: toll/interleukin-1 receptor domain-containing protein [bacterium]|nr:toll/interleukin-1 receptor domain-containing protein [bacterium]